jgi:hypothetical protein
MKIGIIAEDESDVAVLKVLTLRLIDPHRIGFSRFVGDGCGKLRRKCHAWANILVQQGCPWIVVAHDLDQYNEQDLRAALSEAVKAARPKASVVLIPKREIEAWLLYDGAAIAGAFNERATPRVPGDPETLVDPKRFLHDLIWRSYHKQYLNTVHNALIASRIDLRRLRSSTSFAPHPPFAATVKAMFEESDRKRRRKAGPKKR